MKMPVRTLSLIFPPLFVSLLALLNDSLAQTLTVLHSFTANDSPSGNDDGASPQSRLIISGNTLYGTAWEGGKNKVGTLFALNTDGANFRTLRSFAFSDGAAPVAGLVLSGTKLYGATGQGGNGNAGTIFALNTDGTAFTNLFHFAQIDTTNRCSHCFGVNSNGFWPYGTLILSGDTLYGTTFGGTPSGNGTVFSIKTNGTDFKNLYNFSKGQLSTNNFVVNNDGAYPMSGLILSDNSLYGATTEGGSFGYGTIFALNTDGTAFRVLHAFSNVGGDHGDPRGELILTNGTLFGATSGGALFAIQTNGANFRIIHSFLPAGLNPLLLPTNTDGVKPQAGLVLSNNTLYGTAMYGGNAGLGTIFSINTDGSDFTIAHQFSGGSPNATGSYTNQEGTAPKGPLLLSGTIFFGTTTLGGASGSGTIFRLTFTPELKLVAVGGNIVTTWPANYPGYTLQFAADLDPPVNWTAVSPPVLADDNYTVTNTLVSSQGFYRLIRSP